MRTESAAWKQREVLRAWIALPRAQNLRVRPVPQPFVMAIDVVRRQVPALVREDEGPRGADRDRPGGEEGCREHRRPRHPSRADPCRREWHEEGDDVEHVPR